MSDRCTNGESWNPPEQDYSPTVVSLSAARESRRELALLIKMGRLVALSQAAAGGGRLKLYERQERGAWATRSGIVVNVAVYDNGWRRLRFSFLRRDVT